MTVALPYPDTAQPSTRDWRHDAACVGEDPELFFAVGTSGPAQEQNERAKAVCRRCVVADRCLAWALESGQDDGVWGGLSEDERRRVYKRRVARLGSPVVQQNPLDKASPEAREVALAAGGRGALPAGTPIAVKQELKKLGTHHEYLSSNNHGAVGVMRATQLGRDALRDYWQPSLLGVSS